MLQSVAWQHKTIPLWHILERLEIEHMRHAGACNGSLSVSYRQLAQHGVSRNDILRAIQLGQDLGLLKVRPNSTKHNGQIRADNIYTLTYLEVDGAPPTDDWKCINETTAKAAQHRYSAVKSRAFKKKKKTV